MAMRQLFWWATFPVRLFFAMIVFLVCAAMTPDIEEAKREAGNVLMGRN